MRNLGPKLPPTPFLATERSVLHIAGLSRARPAASLPHHTTSVNLTDLLDAASLPLAPTPDYRTTLQSHFHRYRGLLDSLDSPDIVSRTIHTHRGDAATFSARLLKVVDHLQAGEDAAADARLQDALEGMDPWIGLLTSQHIDAAKSSPLYRVREGSPAEPISLGGIFHPDAERAHLASPARFSIAGTPSLYLARSLFTAWYETGCPDKSACWVSRFELNPGSAFRVLDLGYTPELIADMVRRTRITHEPTLGPVGGFVVAYALCWPLLAACTARPRTASGSPPEYRLPQRLLSWIKDTSDFIGIRYFSSHGIEAESDLLKQNYVFPAKGLGTTGYSPLLCQAFRLTIPVQWQDAAAGGAHLGPPSQHDTQFRDVDGSVRHYHKSEYARAESFLEAQTPNDLSPVL